MPGCRSIHALRRPAAEKRQGTKSRDVGHRQCSRCYEDLYEVVDLVDLGNSKSSDFECVHNLSDLARLLQK